MQGKSWSDALTGEQELRNSWAEAIYRFIYGSNHRFCCSTPIRIPATTCFTTTAASASWTSAASSGFGASRSSDDRDRARMPARRRARDMAGKRRGRVLAIDGPRHPRGSLCILARVLGTVVGGAAVHGHAGACGQVDRAQVLADWSLGQCFSILHRVARVHDDGPDRAGRGVGDRRAARHQLLGVDGSRVLRGRSSAHRRWASSTTRSSPNARSRQASEPAACARPHRAPILRPERAGWCPRRPASRASRSA